MTFPDILKSLSIMAMAAMATPAQAVTTFTEIEGNDTQATANFIGPHDGAIDILGFQKSDFDWFSFYGTAGDRLTLEVQNEGPSTTFAGYRHEFDSVMALHNDTYELDWDDDDDKNMDAFGNEMPQRVRDRLGSYIERTLTRSGMFYVRLENNAISDSQTYDYRLLVRGLTPTAPNATVVPLPAGLPLMVTALGGLAVLRRRRKAS